MSDLFERVRKHVFFTWTAQSDARPVSIASGSGATFLDADGQRWLDFESQVFNCNAGHGQQRIVDAMVAQARVLPCAHPAAVFESKARLGELLAEVTPEGMNRFFLCLSGAEAVENAYKIARIATGRKKVIARRRSYHGASMGALSLTGDHRRLPLEPGLWGVLRAEDPYCHRCPFGLTVDSCGIRCAQHLRTLIELEGPESIAAIFMEGVTGANGGFVPPDEYWPMVREICDEFGILLVADEVFSGFGRCGEWFAVDRWGVKPDMITMAKGISSGYAALGAVGVSDAIADRFEDDTLWCGLTNYAHPVSCAAGVAAIELYKEDGLIQRARALEPVVLRALRGIQSRHPAAISDARGMGLLCTLELSGTPEQHTAVAAGLRRRWMHTLVKGPFLFITPPLVITDAELAEGLEIIEETIAEVMG